MHTVYECRHHLKTHTFWVKSLWLLVHQLRRKALVSLMAGAFVFVTSMQAYADPFQEIKAELDRLPKIGSTKSINVEVDLVSNEGTRVFDTVTQLGDGYEFAGSAIRDKASGRTGDYSGPEVSSLSEVTVASQDELRELREESKRISGKVMATNGAVSGEAEGEIKTAVSLLNAHISSLSGKAKNAVRVRASATATKDSLGFRKARGQIHTVVEIKAVYRGSLSDLRSRLALYQSIADLMASRSASSNQQPTTPNPVVAPPVAPPPVAPPVSTNGARRLSVNVNINGTDDESIGPDEHGSSSFNREITLNDNQARQLPGPPNGDLRWGGECRVELLLTAQKNDNGDVRLDGVALLFEGTSESTTDLDGRAAFSIVIPRGQTLTHSLMVHNTDEGGDFASLSFSVMNTDP